MDIPPDVPQALRDILDSLSIAGLPATISAGEVVKPRISPDVSVFDLLTQEQTLAKLDLKNLFDRLKLTLSLTDVASSLKPPEGDATGLFKIDLNAETLPASPPVELGRANLEVVLKDVEYNPTADLLASHVDTGVAPARGLPYASPTGVASGLLTYTAISSLIKGLVGKVAGVTGQFEKLSGGIGLRDRLTGTVTTTLRTAVPADAAGNFVVPVTRRILEVKPHVEVTWKIEDENGRALAPGVDFYLLEGTELTSSLPALTFLPDFVEYSPSSDTVAQRRISCHVVVYQTAPTPQNPEPPKLAERTLPQITVAMPRVEIPTVLAVTEHAMDRPNSPGAALIVLPLLSEVRGLDKLAAPLLAAQLVLSNLEAVFPSVIDGNPVGGVIPFHKTLEHINTVLGYIRLAPTGRLSTVRADKIADIWWVPRNPGVFKVWYESFEDVISSIVLLGPPGRAALFHKPKELAFREGGQQGVFQLKVGPTAVAAVRDLGAVDGTTPAGDACEPSGAFGSEFKIVVPVHADSQKRTFNDEISSLQFAPMG
ncbi:MAG TPA: hypothetical protein VF538_08520 [Pyrinomonadaceae bacterium]|jgi:hypothetical protein